MKHSWILRLAVGVFLIGLSGGLAKADGLRCLERDVLATYDIPFEAMSIEVAGDIAYFGSTVGLDVLDVSDPGNPTLIGTYTSNGWWPVDMDSAGAFVYAINQFGFQIIDMTDPTVPKFAGEYINHEHNYRAVKAHGPVVYLVDSSQIDIVDVSNPVNPVLAGTISLDNPSFLVGIAIEGEFLYTLFRSGDVVVYDISDPVSPVFAGMISLLDFARTIDVLDGVVFVTLRGGDQLSRLVALDAKDPKGLAVLGEVEVPLVSDVRVVGERAYVTGFQAGLHVVDVSDPSALEIVRSYDSFTYSIRVEAGDQIAYVVDEYSLRIIDVTGQRDSPMLGSVIDRDVFSVDRHGDTLYAAGGALWMIDIQDPTAPEVIGSLETPGLYYYEAQVNSSGTMAYASSEQGLEMIDVSNPTMPKVAGMYESFDNIYAYQVDGTTVYIATEGVGIVLVDVSDAQNPVVLSVIDASVGWASKPMIADGRLFFLDRDGDIQLYDVHDPGHPLFVSTFDMPLGGAQAIDIVGDLVYSVRMLWFEVIDYSRPAIPARTRINQLDIEFEGIEVIGSTAYLRNHSLGLHLFDVSDLGNVRRVGWFGGDGPASDGLMNDVAIQGDVAYIAQYWSDDVIDVGVTVVDLSDCTPCPADFNGDGLLDFHDVAGFLAAFGAGGLEADFTDDGVLDFFDISAFLSAFSAGCP